MESASYRYLKHTKTQIAPAGAESGTTILWQKNGLKLAIRQSQGIN